MKLTVKKENATNPTLAINERTVNKSFLEEKIRVGKPV
jgi:hypothetical protein